MTSHRHVLIVATQCPRLGLLGELGEAARQLREVLTDQALGACRPGLPDGRSVLSDDALTGAHITELVRVAIRYAAQQQATLVLAFVGHGTLAGNDPTLYYMAPDSEPDDRSRAVNVPVLLTEAVDAAGVDGVIALLDTCNAAGAAISRAHVLAGVRAGRIRYELLMASAVSQDAHDMVLTRTLAEVLRRGVANKPARLDAASVLDVLRQRITTQDTPYDRFDGDDSAEEPLWLAHNLQGMPAASLNWGSHAGTQALRESLAGLDLAVDLTQHLGLEDLHRLRERLSSTGDEGTQARAVVGNLILAHQAAAFLNMSMPESLSSHAFRRALLLARMVDDEPVPVSDEYSLLAHIATRHPTADRDGRCQVARFVAALVLGQTTPVWEAAEDWATSIRARTAFNEARSEFESRSAGQRLRLAIGLHQTALGAVWPGSVTGWLYDENGSVMGREEVDCADNQAGVEQAVSRLVDWGAGLAEVAGVELEHLDIAVPTDLLAADWQPEGIEYHTRLDEQFSVTVRWANRLQPSVAMARSIKRAARLLADIGRSRNVPPVDWLDADDMIDPGALRGRFVSGDLKQAVAIARRPRDCPEVLATVLNYAPIVLWPQTVPELTPDRRGCLTPAWDKLPDAFPELYRRLRRGETTDDTAHLRAVWDDNRWLRFCRRFQYTPLPDGEE